MLQGAAGCCRVRTGGEEVPVVDAHPQDLVLELGARAQVGKGVEGLLPEGVERAELHVRLGLAPEVAAPAEDLAARVGGWVDGEDDVRVGPGGESKRTLRARSVWPRLAPVPRPLVGL